MLAKTHWGILSTGRIATKSAEDPESASDAELAAVGSRLRTTAEVFADKSEIEHRYDTCEALAADADIDVIYLGTPHSFHKENALLSPRTLEEVLQNIGALEIELSQEECAWLDLNTGTRS